MEGHAGEGFGGKGLEALDAGVEADFRTLVNSCHLPLVSQPDVMLDPAMPQSLLKNGKHKT